MSSSKLVVQGAAGALGGAGENIEDLFSTYLYTGDGTTSKQITNDIDLSTEGGLVWIKRRSDSSDHRLMDTERGASSYLASNLTDASSTGALSSFNTDGFTIGNASAPINANNSTYASWTFRKAPRFFDCVTYTGDGVAGRTVSHNLGSVPACIMIKRTDANGHDWFVYHRGVDATAPEDYYIRLNENNARTDFTAWNDTAPTSTEFTLGSFSSVNGSGGTFVAYLFAHNDDDGEFGPDGDADIIKCGSFTHSTSTGNEIDLGFEPQWLLYKAADGTTGWYLWDTMRGWSVTEQSNLRADAQNAESTGSNTSAGWPQITSTGFRLGTNSNAGDNKNYIYIAIRRGPMAVPEDADDVFDVAARTGASGNKGAYRSGFPVDMAFHKVVTSAINAYEIGSRLTQGKSMNTNDTSAEVIQSDQQYDYMDGWNTETSASSTKYSWMWRRAPNYFDVVAYTGNGTAGHTVSHNLGVAPEMMWVKKRNAAEGWQVYHSALTATDFMELNQTSAASSSTGRWNNTEPTATDFTLGSITHTNASADTYIAYLFASLDGVSKVGSASHTTGSNTDVDCGFSAGARFVILKGTHASGWQVFDTVRGIVTGNDPTLSLHNTSAEDSSQDRIDPYSSGFSIGPDIATGTYIFYAIA